jgi:hypothetical protein
MALNWFLFYFCKFNIKNLFTFYSLEIVILSIDLLQLLDMFTYHTLINTLELELEFELDMFL